MPTQFRSMQARTGIVPGQLGNTGGLRNYQFWRIKRKRTRNTTWNLRTASRRCVYIYIYVCIMDYLELKVRDCGASNEQDSGKLNRNWLYVGAYGGLEPSYSLLKKPMNHHLMQAPATWLHAIGRKSLAPYKTWPLLDSKTRSSLGTPYP